MAIYRARRVDPSKFVVRSALAQHQTTGATPAPSAPSSPSVAPHSSSHATPTTTQEKDKETGATNVTGATKKEVTSPADNTVQFF